MSRLQPPTIPERDPAGARVPETIQMLSRWRDDVTQPGDVPVYADDAYQAVAAPVRFELRITNNAHDRPSAQGVIFGSGHVALCSFTGTGSDRIEVSTHRSFWEAVFGLEQLWIVWLDTPPSWLRRQ